MKTPSLAHDKMMFERFGSVVSPNGRLERKIVAALCQHLKGFGFLPTTVFDGEETTAVETAKDAMELVFNLDEASLRFQLHKDGDRSKPMFKQHGVLLVLGNGEDIISDWNYMQGDHDGFNAAMESFNVDALVR